MCTVCVGCPNIVCIILCGVIWLFSHPTHLQEAVVGRRVVAVGCADAYSLTRCVAVCCSVLQCVAVCCRV